MNRSNLYEGMWAGDLSDIVQPLVSIDEYASKIDDDALVLGFYVGDEDAARDLNRFIQRSPVTMVDSDVSPAPDQSGHYMVFVEVIRNDRLVDNITALLDEIQPLASIDYWQMKVRNAKKMTRYDAKKLETILKANRMADRMATLEDKLSKLGKAMGKVEGDL